MGEDPYLVSQLGTAYVRGLETAGIIATLKHFAGYSASQGARNHAPVSMGPRELADVHPAAVRDAVRVGGARSVMNSYTDDRRRSRSASDPALLTGVLRDAWGFTGTVVSDYCAVAFLQLMHRIAGTEGEAAALALAAGIDVELPSTLCYGGRCSPRSRPAASTRRWSTEPCAGCWRRRWSSACSTPDWTPEATADAGIDLDSAAQP